MDDRRDTRLGDVEAAPLRSGNELELRSHQLRDPWARPREDHWEEDAGRPAGEGAGPAWADDTTDPGTPAIPEPALHAFTSERRSQLGIPAATPFYEESTYWNPSWTITHGAIQTSNIFDVAARRSASERASCCRRRRTRR